VDVNLSHRHLLGGELDAEIEHQTAKDSTVGSEKPLALQLHILATSESMDHHDSEIMDDGRIDRGDA
jgi:hypothetical protein